jgi:hypothetical protein
VGKDERRRPLGEHKRRYGNNNNNNNNNNKMNKNNLRGSWSGLIWLRIRKSGELLGAG